ncbi:MAG: metallophosphoesterase [Rhizobiales bacterium]|nr:metallophosphoesterase [Hyphomicrobiales bacterium]MBI3673416.1 metallophosphoesterase [Hyphomicrobiales bacterium]
MFSLAHLSDVHLGPLPPGAAWRNFRLKRPVGFLSWHLRRKHHHDPAVADLIAADIAAAGVHHVALTGDLVNIAAHAEFPAAARWMESLGPPDEVSFVPGNHDCYVACAWEQGLVHLAPWMAGDLKVRQTLTSRQIAAPFPFVRLRKNVALIGLSSGLPQVLWRAGGSLGPRQLDSLAELLGDLRERGYARVVMIHHPPLPGLAPPRKALSDAGELRDVLVAEGAELVLHGHNHRHMLNRLETRYGLCHVLGVPSASIASADERYTPAAWNFYRIVRQDGRWTTQTTVRGYDPAARRLVTLSEFALST